MDVGRLIRLSCGLSNESLLGQTFPCSEMASSASRALIYVILCVADPECDMCDY